MSSSTDVNKIIFNQMSDNKYDTLTPTEGQFYVTPDYIDLPLLTSMWFDHIVNDMSWLRSDTFAWQSGDVYTAVYNHLVSDISGKTASSETVGGVTISYYLANDGHKITTDETSVANIYDATGVAWYYVLDTTNHRFKLPITKFGFTGLRDNVGNYISPGLPNITGEVRKICEEYNQSGHLASGAFQGYTDEASYSYTSSDQTAVGSFNFDASRSSSIYGSSTTVQPPATQMYLYFYIGNFTHTATEQTAGITTAALNNKMDNDLGNSGPISDTFKTRLNSAGIRYVKETWQSGTEWYRVWSDNWIEQGGTYSYTGTSAGFYTLTYNKAFTSTNYSIIGTGYRSDSSPYQGFCTFKDWTTTGCGVAFWDDSTSNPGVIKWYACGY